MKEVLVVFLNKVLLKLQRDTSKKMDLCISVQMDPSLLATAHAASVLNTLNGRIRILYGRIYVKSRVFNVLNFAEEPFVKIE